MEDFLRLESENFGGELEAAGLYQKAKPPYSIVSVAHKPRETDSGELIKGGRFYYRKRLYIPQLDEESEEYDPDSVTTDVSEESFAPVEEFKMILFSTNLERIRFNETDRKKIDCFSRDAKYPDKDNPFSDECAKCPLAAPKLEPNIRCNLIPNLMGLDSKSRPVVVQLGMSSMASYRQFLRDMEDVRVDFKNRNESWVPFRSVIKLKLLFNKDYSNYSVIFPTKEELANAKALPLDYQEGIYKSLEPIRAKWHPRYMEEGTRKLGKKIDGESRPALNSGDMAPERRAIGSGAKPGAPQFKRPSAPAPVANDDSSAADVFADQ